MMVAVVVMMIVVVMIVVMTIAVPGCGWSRSADGNNAGNAQRRDDHP